MRMAADYKCGLAAVVKVTGRAISGISGTGDEIPTEPLAQIQ